MTGDFLRNLETKVKDQMKSQNVGFLLGAGSSYLSGEGYPLAAQLWGNISGNIPDQERQDIQEKLDSGANGIEHALDLLDTGGVVEGPHRHSVTTAIADYFEGLKQRHPSEATSPQRSNVTPAKQRHPSEATSPQRSNVTPAAAGVYL